MIFLFLFLYMLEEQLIFFSLFLDDGGDSAYDGKEELQRLDILSMERSQFIVKHNQMSLMTVMMMCTLRLLVECYYLMFI